MPPETAFNRIFRENNNRVPTATFQGGRVSYVVMDRKANQTLILVLLIIIPVVAILAALLISNLNAPQPVTVPEVAFLESSGPVERFVSGISVPVNTSATQPSTWSGQSDESRSNPVIRTVDPLSDGRLILAGFPDCYYFQMDGTVTGKLTLEQPDESLIESIEKDSEEDLLRLIDYEFLIASAATESGRIYGIFQETRTDPALLVEWDPDGMPVSVTDIRSLFESYDYTDWGSRELLKWSICCDGEQVVVSNSAIAFIIIMEGKETSVVPIDRFQFYMLPSGVVPHNRHFFDRGSSTIPMRRKLDGSIDWDWVKKVNSYVQVSSDGFDASSLGYFIGFYCFSDKDGEFLFTPNGVAELDSDGNLEKMIGSRKTIETLTYYLDYKWAMCKCLETDDGWLLIRFTNVLYNNDDSIPAVHVDRDFNYIETIEFKPLKIEDETESEAEDLLVSDESATFPTLTTGYYADPRVIRHDFHVIPDGYRAVDHTKRRVITTNRDLEITAILDRSADIPNGLWMDIDDCQVNSSGEAILLDRDQNLVQVLDGSGNYIRRHLNLGLDLFGVALEPDSIHLDSLDRLWVIGLNRIFVIDRYGNLARIFERQGADYNFQAQSANRIINTHESHLGYTVLPSNDPFRRGVTSGQPIVIEVNEFNSFALGGDTGHGGIGGIGAQLFYIGQDMNNRVIIFDWNGNRRGEIDLGSLVPSNERRFMVGPDGYLYLLDPASGYVLVMDPLGEPIKSISIEGLPSDGWLSPPPLYSQFPEPPRIRCYIDFEGRLVVFDTGVSEIRVYPLREVL